MINNFIDKCSAAREGSCDTMDVEPSNMRELFTFETGLVLETIGKMFVNIPPFNDHIDPNTGQMLISIGKKLKRK